MLLCIVTGTGVRWIWLWEEGMGGEFCLDVLSRRCLVGPQEEASSNQLGMITWSSGEGSAPQSLMRETYVPPGG